MEADFTFAPLSEYGFAGQDPPTEEALVQGSAPQRFHVILGENSHPVRLTPGRAAHGGTDLW